jgi:site-specific recombinase XerD
LVKQGKGKKDRYVLTSKLFIKDAMQYLESRKDNNPYMFISDHNKNAHISIRTAEEIVKQAAKTANIRRRVFPHALRSTFATHLHQNGTDILNIQKLLGHSRIDTTRRYTKTDFRMINSITSPLDND